jgi:PiT family inorganic phosphate transporter
MGTIESIAPAIVGAALLAYANGANDNFKGVATLYGSGVLSFRTAIIAGTTATWVGSVAALLLAEELIKTFSGKGLVSPDVLSQGNFAVAVSTGAALTVLLATRLGLPISTTHALVGGLVGAGLATGSLLAEQLVGSFLMPLALSPLMAAGLAGFGYLSLKAVRTQLGVVEDDCLCLDASTVATVASAGGGLSMTSIAAPELRVGDAKTCSAGGRPLPGLTSLRALDLGHVVSGILVSFARGLNDTPKIAGILLIGSASTGSLQQGTIVAVASVMAVGGMISARRVAQTMSLKITDMNEGQGFAANVVTSLLVLGATKIGVPVSTTHISCGALFGIGVASGNGHLRTIATIFGAWIITLPAAAIITAIICIVTNVS